MVSGRRREEGEKKMATFLNTAEAEYDDGSISELSVYSVDVGAQDIYSVHLDAVVAVFCCLLLHLRDLSRCR